MLGIQDSPRIICLGICLLGVAVSTITVTLLPEVLDCIVKQLPKLESEELNNVIAGYYNSCIGVGQTLGPISAGTLVGTYGYRTSVDIQAFIMLVYALIYFLVNGNFTLLRPEKMA